MANLFDMSQIKYNGFEIQFIKINGVIIYSANTNEEGGTFSIDITDFSVDLNSTITIEYVAENISANRITTTYDSSKFTKISNSKFTVISEGLNTIVYNIDGKPHTTIRVATAESAKAKNYNATLDFNTGIEPDLPDFITLTKQHSSSSYGFTYGEYQGGGYGLISSNAGISNSCSYGCIKIDASELSGSFKVQVTYNVSSESANYDYSNFILNTSSSATYSSSGFGKQGGTTYKTVTGTGESLAMSSPGIYYLHFFYRKDGSVDKEYDCLCIKKIEIIHTSGEATETVYPATRILVEPSTIEINTGESFDLVATLMPPNADEEVEIVYDKGYLSKTNNTFTALKTGTSNITYNTIYCSESVDVNIAPTYIDSITLATSLSSLENVAPGSSFTITPTILPSIHDDEIVVEYDSTYLTRTDNKFKISPEAKSMSFTITYTATNSGVSSSISFTTSDKAIGYFIEYTVHSTNVALSSVYNNQYGRGLPRIYSTSSNYTFTGYEKIEITLNDGTITTDTSTLCSNIAKVKLWYPETTKAVKFYGTHLSSYKTLVKTVEYCNTSNFTDMEQMFYYCSYLTSVECADWDTSKVTKMGDVFRTCTALTRADVSNWNTDLITDMGSIFDDCNALTSIDVSNWNTDLVTDMRWTFSGCELITELDLSNWDTSLVTDMYGMFEGCYSLLTLDIRNFDMTNVICDTSDEYGTNNCAYMLDDCSDLQTLRLDNCNAITLNKIINHASLPTNSFDNGKIYCKEESAAGLVAPEGWVFEYV